MAVAKRRLTRNNGTVGINDGLRVIERAIDDNRDVGVARQVLSNWRHRLDGMTVLDHTARRDLLDQMAALSEAIHDLHTDPRLLSRRQTDARVRLEPIRRRLIALVGEHGLD
jgi:hypothetical protein